MHIIFERYRDRLVRRQRSASTVQNFDKSVRALEQHCNGTGVDPGALTEQDIEEWCYSNGYAVSTRRLHYSNIASAYKYAHQDGLIARYPFVNTEMPREEERRPRVIPSAKLRVIRMNCVEEREWVMFHLFALTGCRRFEIQKATWEDVEETPWGWQLEVLGKGGKLRYVPIHPELQQVLGARYEGPLLSGYQGEMIAQTSMYESLKRMGGNGFGFHDFRRTVASSLDANGVDQALIERILGWSRRSIFDKHYRNVADERLHRAMLQLYVDDPL